MKLLIEVQVYNRKAITEITLNQLKEHKQDADLRIINDFSTEYDNKWLSQFSDNVIQHEKKLTINKLKYRTFKNFLDTEYTHLYMTDNDMYHDPEFMKFIKTYKSNNLPMTLYRSSFIHSFKDKVSRYVKNYKDISLKQGLYGGASVFLTREHVQKICDSLPETEDIWDKMCEKIAWDSKIQSMIDKRRAYLIPNRSLCEHFGVDGQNHKERNSDFALNPTDHIKEVSDEIWNRIL